MDRENRAILIQNGKEAENEGLMNGQRRVQLAE